MKKENSVTWKAGELPGRLTLARASAFRASGELPPLKEQQPRANQKRAVSDNTCLQRKKRAVLQDVTNFCCENACRSCFNSTKIQAKKSKLAKASQINVSKVAPPVVAVELPQLQVDSKSKSLVETGLISKDAMCSINLENKALLQLSATNGCGKDDRLLGSQTSGISAQPLIPQKKAKKGSLSELLSAVKDPEITNIDADIEDPQLCSLYAADIYDNLRVAEACVINTMPFVCMIKALLSLPTLLP